MDIAHAARTEVIERHAFFVDWFTGRADEAAMDASARVFPAEMRMIGPDGSISEGVAVAAMIRGARGGRPADFAIRVEVHEARALAPDLALVLYDEHQSVGGTASARRSSALFRAAPDAPNGVAWLLVHETWIDRD